MTLQVTLLFQSVLNARRLRIDGAFGGRLFSRSGTRLTHELDFRVDARWIWDWYVSTFYYFSVCTRSTIANEGKTRFAEIYWKKRKKRK